jgi:hypothetical protein
MNKDKQSSFGEKVSNILHELNIYPVKVEIATEQIVELVKSELVPDESKSTCVCDRDACWNDCRQEILDKLDSPKEL